MVDLYHAEPMANSLKSLIAIHEKGVKFTSHFVNLHKFEQHEPAFVKINPNGQVPALLHQGKVITESTVINEYLDEAFEGPALRPADAYGRARMRVWTKFVDEYFCPALSFIGWHHMIRHITDKLTPEEFEEKVRRIPLKEQQDKWRAVLEAGVHAAAARGVEAADRRVGRAYREAACRNDLARGPGVLPRRCRRLCDGAPVARAIQRTW